MAKIHFVWWGNPQRDKRDLMAKAVDTPNRVATNCQAHEVHYWRQAGDFNPILDPKIIVHEVNDPFSIIDGTLACAGNGIRMKNILDTMNHYKMYASVKDLLSLAIMVKEGGFFFDTTMVLPQGTVRFNEALNQEPNGPRVPYYEGGVGKTMKVNDDSLDYTLSFPYGIPYGAGVDNIPNFDVWAFYSKPNEPLFLYALDSYLNRAQNAGLDKIDAPVMITRAKTTKDILEQEKKETRNSLISGLSIASIVQGLMKKSKECNQNITEFGWKAKKKDATNEALFQGASGSVTIEKLGINKAFGGSWREV